MKTIIQTIHSLLFDTQELLLVSELSKAAKCSRHMAKKALDAEVASGRIQYHPSYKSYTLRSEAAEFFVALKKEGPTAGGSWKPSICKER